MFESLEKYVQAALLLLAASKGASFMPDMLLESVWGRLLANPRLRFLSKENPEERLLRRGGKSAIDTNDRPESSGDNIVEG